MEWRRGDKSRNYTLHVLGNASRKGAIGTGLGNADLAATKGAAESPYLAEPSRGTAWAELSLGASTYTVAGSGIEAIADHGARPPGRNTAWPVLVASGCAPSAPGDSMDTPQSQLQPGKYLNKGAAWVLREKKKAGIFDQGLTHKPFHAGSPRPRMLERKLASEDPKDASLSSSKRNKFSTWGSDRGSSKVGDALKTRRRNAKDEDKAPPGAVQRVEPVLSRLRHLHSRKIRLKAVDSLRKNHLTHWHHVSEGKDMDASMADALAIEAYDRNFQPSYTFRIQEMIEALADVGIKAETHKQKVQFVQNLDRFEEGAAFERHAFFRALSEARFEAQAFHSRAVNQAWRQVDEAEQRGGLHAKQLQHLLSRLDLMPHEEAEMHAISEMIEHLHTDNFGLVVFHEAEKLVQQVREYKQSTKRQLERDLQNKHSIPLHIFTDFRYQLVELDMMFQRLDKDKSGKLDENETMDMLTECGCMS